MYKKLVFYKTIHYYLYTLNKYFLFLTKDLTMNKFVKLFLSAVIPLAIVGCNSSNSHNPDDPSSKIRALHASADAPNVDILINGDIALSNVSYKDGSGYLSVPTMFDASINVASTDTIVLDLAGTELVADTKYTVIAANSAAELEAIVLDDTVTEPAEGNLVVRVVHGAKAAPTVDIYITAPNDELSVSTPITASFKDFTEFLEVPAGDYRIRVTAEGDSNVLFDSGTISLTAGLNLTVVAVESEYVVAPIDLVALTGDSENPTLEINDNRAQLRVAHLSPDAPNVDVYAGAAGTNELANDAVLENVPFKAISDYLLLDSGSYDISVTATGDSTAVLEVEGLELTGNTSYTAAAVNFLADIEALPSADDLTPPAAGNVKVRVIHASPDAPEVDVLVNDTVTLEDIAFKGVSNYLEIPAGNYNFKVNAANTETTVIDVDVNLVDGAIYSVHAVGALAEIEPLLKQDN